MAQADDLDEQRAIKSIQSLDVDLAFALLKSLLNVVLNKVENEWLSEADDIVGLKHLVRVGGPEFLVDLEGGLRHFQVGKQHFVEPCRECLSKEEIDGDGQKVSQRLYEFVSPAGDLKAYPVTQRGLAPVEITVPEVERVLE